MILSTIALSLAIGHALCQPATTTSSPPSCPSVSVQVNRGAYIAWPDRDPNFLYSRDNCSSTSQQIISTNWTVSCGPAIQSICGATSTTSAVVGKWTWSWFNDIGSTCQVGLWQPDAAAKAPVGITIQCCESAFNALLVEIVDQVDENNGGASLPNRGSINIASGGYPFAESTGDNGVQTLANGVQAAQGYLSFIIQGIAAPYPFNSINSNCTGQDVKNNPEAKNSVYPLPPGT